MTNSDESAENRGGIEDSERGTEPVNSRSPKSGELTWLLSRQELAWQKGERPTIERLAAELPKDDSLEEKLLSLIANEIYLREQAGESPLLQDYQRAFPHLARAIEIQWEVDHFIAPTIPDQEKSAVTAKTQPSLYQHSQGDLRGAPAELLNHPRYRLVKLLGEGGMGTVWLAVHQVLDRLVALKTIRSAFVADELDAARFRREVKAIAKLQHRNIVCALDAEQIGELNYLVVEYVEGYSLAERVRQSRLTIAEACSHICDIANGLAYAHSHGMVHRDVKPGNIMVARDGVAKLLDFGLAFESGHESTLTDRDMVVGTPDYISPEQAVDSHQADARSDIYSLGCTLYHLLAGRAPYADESPIGKIDSHRFSRPPRIDGLPPGLMEIIFRMMATLPDDRYRSTQDVVDVLRPYCHASFAQIAGEPAVSDSTTRRGSKRLSRRAAMIAGAGALGGMALWIPQRPWKTELSKQVRKSIAYGKGENTEQRNPLPNISTAESDGVAEEIRHPMLEPTTIGDGNRNQYSIQGNTLVLDATQFWQIWLNYAPCNTPQLVMRGNFCFRSWIGSSVLKFVFLLDYVGEYNIQYRPGDKCLILSEHIGKSSSILDQTPFIPPENGEWCSFEFRMTGAKLQARHNGQLVLNGDCRHQAVRYICAVAAQLCRVELFDARFFETAGVIDQP